MEPVSPFHLPIRRLRVRLLPTAFLLAALTLLIAWPGPVPAAAATRAIADSDVASPNELGLASFGGKVVKAKFVVLTWETGAELSILGFNVWRRTGQGEWAMLNAGMIPALSTGQPSGNEYHFRDRAVVQGKKYWYQLEVVTTDGYSVFSDAVKLKVR